MSELEQWAAVLRELNAKGDVYEQESRELGARLQALRDKRNALGLLVHEATNGLHCAAMRMRQPGSTTPDSLRAEAMKLDG